MESVTLQATPISNAASSRKSATVSEDDDPRPAPANITAPLRTTDGHYTTEQQPIQHLVYLPQYRMRYLSPDTQPARPEAGWPAIVFLHGAGEVRTSLTFLRTALGATGALPHLASLTAVEAAEQNADDPYRWSVAEAALRGYVVVAPLAENGWADEAECHAVIRLAEALPERHKVDPKRIFITGVSMGGYGALRVTAMAPRLFAGVAALCGYGQPQWAPIISGSNVSVLLAHGVNDQIVPFRESEAMFAELNRAHHRDATLWTLDPSADPLDNPGTGHAAWRNVYSDTRFWDWLRRRARQDVA